MYARISSQDTLNTSGTTSVTTTYGTTATTGNLLVATVFSGGIGLGSTTISGWTSAVSVSFLSAADECTILYKIAAGTESAVAANCSGASSMVLAIHEFSTGPLQSVQTQVDQTNSNSNAGVVTTLTVGSITPTKPQELVVALMGFPTGGTSAWAWDNGVTKMSSNANLVDGFLVDQDITARNPASTWTGLSTAGGCIVSFFSGSQADNPFTHVIIGDGMGRSEVAN